MSSELDVGSNLTGNAALAAPDAELLAEAEKLWQFAHQSGDRRKELTTLTDLGVVYRRGGLTAKAVETLRAALALARELQEPRDELDILDNLAMVALASRRADRAVEILNQVVSAAHDSGDRYQEKMALEHLGTAYAALPNVTQAQAAYNSALALARELDDQHHVADLLWSQAILNADSNQPDEAVARANEAIELYRRQGSPFVPFLQAQLDRYRDGGSLRLDPAHQSSTPSAQPATGIVGEPSLLRMAMSAAKSIRQFFSSGFQTVPNATYEQRLQTCRSCEHHTGVRCSLCGCFCSIKAQMPHEDCPARKWPR